LWEALDSEILCPFQYFGINDTVDLSSISFQRGKYVSSELDNVLTGNHIRALRIHQQIQELVTNPDTMKALGFCAGVNHARFMANEFAKFGYRAASLDGNTNETERKRIRDELLSGKLNAVFVVDIYNEGVDLPAVDTLLLLRPTESSTIFLQQLGRGLRKHTGKHVLTVLDFIGQARREYRYDVRYRALLGGGTRKKIISEIENDFPHLPSGCVIRLDRIAKDHVLKNVRGFVNSKRTHLISELSQLGPHTTLQEFLQETDTDLEEVYARPRSDSGHCFTQLLDQAGFVPANYDPGNPLFGNLGKILHVDDPERINLWLQLLEGELSLDPRNPGRSYRIALMLFSLLKGKNVKVDKIGKMIAELQSNRSLHSEMHDLLDLLADRIRSDSRPLFPEDQQPAINPETGAPNQFPAVGVPISSHSTYTLSEIMAAFHRVTNDVILIPQGGVLWDPTTKTDLLFVTLEKSEEDFSPSTMYNDYPMSLTQFHWMSQNSTGVDSATGQRYISHEKNGSRVILFTRQHKKINGKAQPYHCLGFVRYRSHESERPMKIIWELERPMPGWMYQESKVLAG